MCTEHDQFVGLVGSRNFSDDVEGILIVVVELVLNFHFEAHRHLLVEQPPDASIMFDCHHHLSRYGSISRISASATLHEDGSAATGTGFEGRRDALLEEEFESRFV